MNGTANVNPYLPPSANVVTTSSDAEQIRHELLKHETSLRSIGLLYYIGFFSMLLYIVVLGVLLVGNASEQDAATASVSVGMLVVFGLLAWLYYFMAKGMRSLDPGVRTAVTIMSCIGLLALPVGTLISAYILYLVHSEKGKRIMTREYQEIVAQTPHIKYKTPIWLIILVLLLLGLIVLGIVLAMSS